MKFFLLNILLLSSFSVAADANTKISLLCSDIDAKAQPYYEFMIQIDRENETAKFTVFELPFKGSRKLPKSFPLDGFQAAKVFFDGSDIDIDGRADGDAGYTSLVVVDEKGTLGGDLVFPNSSQLIQNGKPLGDGGYISLLCR